MKSKRSKRTKNRTRPSKTAESSCNQIGSVRSAILLQSKEGAISNREPLFDHLDNIITRILSIDEPTPSPTLSFEEIRELCLRGREILLHEPPFVKVEPPLFVFGDIHGQLADLKKMITHLGTPLHRKFLFLGDYVDRGAFGVETISLLLAFKLRFSNHIHLLRGNHETRVVNTVYGFSEECRRKYGAKGNEIWALFQSTFNCLPLAAVVGERIFCVHGGISEYLYTFDQLLRMCRPTEVTDVGLLVDLIWADPSKETKTFAESPRGISKIFGKQAVDNFCELLEVDLICRAHQCVQDGYEFFADRRCLTIFSAPNYCGENDNKAGVLHVNKDLKCQVLTFKPEVTNSTVTARGHSRKGSFEKK